MSLKTIKVPMWDQVTNRLSGSRTVSAESIGPFSIFRSINFEDRWTLHHDKTGRGVSQILESRASARRLGKALVGFNWDFELIGNETGHEGPRWARFPRRVRSDMRKASDIAANWER